MGPVATPKMRRYKKSPFALRASSSCTEVWTPTAGCCQVPIGQWRPHPESHRLSEPPVLCASMLSPGSAYGHHLGLETTTALRASAAAILRAGKIFVPTPSFSEVFPNGILGFPEPTVCRPNCRDARLVRPLYRLKIRHYIRTHEPCVPTFRWFCERASARRFRPDGGRPEKSRRGSRSAAALAPRLFSAPLGLLVLFGP